MERCDAWQRVYCNFSHGEHGEHGGNGITTEERRNGDLSRFNTKARSLRRRHEEDGDVRLSLLLAPRSAVGWAQSGAAESTARIPTVFSTAPDCAHPYAGPTGPACQQHGISPRSSRWSTTSFDLLARRPEAGVGRESIGCRRKHHKLPEVFSPAPDAFAPTAHRAVPADAAVRRGTFSSCRLRELRVFVLTVTVVPIIRLEARVRAAWSLEPSKLRCSVPPL